MPRPYPPEFRHDAFAVPRQGGAVALIAMDVGFTLSCLRSRLRRAGFEDRNRSDSPFITRPAPGVGLNPGGAREVVTVPSTDHFGCRLPRMIVAAGVVLRGDLGGPLKAGSASPDAETVRVG